MKKNKKALIFGITGQDGSYLAEFLLKKNYIIHGVKRRSSSANTERIDHIFDSINFKNKNFFIHYGDITDSSSTLNIINKIKPDEIYNLAAQSHVKVSFDIPEYTANSTALGTLRILEALKSLNLKKQNFIKLQVLRCLVNKIIKNHRMKIQSFTQCQFMEFQKFLHIILQFFIEKLMVFFASNGILFNHESPRRGPTFVTKKIIQGLVRIKLKKQKILSLGNLYAVRDWGHAKDYVESMWKILQFKKPDDWVISTNKKISVKDFVKLCAKKLEIEIIWKNKGLKRLVLIKKQKNNH